MQLRSKYMALATIGLTLGMTLGPAASVSAKTLTGVYAAMVNGGLELVIMGEALARPRIVKASDGKEVRFEFEGSINAAEGTRSFRVGTVKSIKYGWYDRLHSTAAVTASLRVDAEPKVSEVIGGWKVRFEAAKPMADADPAPTAVALPLPAVLASPVVAMPSPSHPVPIELIGAVPGFFLPGNSQRANILKAKAVVDKKPFVGAPELETSSPNAVNVYTTKTITPKSTPTKMAGTKSMAPVKATDASPAKPSKQEDPMSRLVSLDFTNTDVVQILKAITIQAGVNIVTAPDVKQSISVSLDRVAVRQALDVVTQIAKLSYQKQGSVYMVSVAEPTVAPPPVVTLPVVSNRIVPIFSGDAKEIRASVLALIAQQRSMGSYQIFLPKDNFAIEKPATASGPSMTDVKLGQASSAAADKATEANDKAEAAVRVNGLREQYVIVIGPTDHIEEVANQIRETDRMIANAYGRDYSGAQELISRTYVVRSDKATAADLVKAVSADGSNLNVDLIATPRSYVNQVVIINGREANVNRAEAMLRQLDSSGYGNEFVSYEVKYTDPRSLRESLVALIPGLRVSIAPNGAGNPNLFQSGEANRQGQDVSNPAGNQNQGQSQGSTQQSAAVATSSTSAISDSQLESPFGGGERQAVPMRILMRGTTEQIQQAQKFITQLDIPQKQVAIELRVMEITKDDSIKAGIDWNILGGGAVKFIRLNNSQTTPANSIGGNISGKNFSGDITASLDALGSNGKLIARPNTFVQDGRQAELFVGDTVRYVASISQTQNGTTIVTGEVPVGVRFAVLPRIGGDGNVTLDLRPRMSLLKGFTDIPNGGKLPQTSNRIEGSTLTMKSGQTIAIGGLIQDQDSATMQGVPFLQDIPIIGHLFKKSTTQRVRTEIVFFLTVKVIDGPVEGDGNNLIMQDESKTNGSKKSNRKSPNTAPDNAPSRGGN